jgi:hypothetical protein
MNVLGTRILPGALALALLLTLAAPASAASPLAAIPVGQSVNYHLTTQSDKPEMQGGQSSASHFIRFTRISVTAFGVQIDGAPAGQITANEDGSFNIPQALKKPLAPFGEIALLTRGAPQPLAPNSSWAANVPVPLGDETDNVAATVAVSAMSASGATIVANGQNATSVQGLRSHPADVDFNATMNYNAARMLTSANSNISVSVKKGAFRSKNATSSWTLTLAGQ